MYAKPQQGVRKENGKLALVFKRTHTDVPLKKRFIKGETEAQIMASHSSILARTIPWKEEPGELSVHEVGRVRLKESGPSTHAQSPMVDLTCSGSHQAGDLL